MSEEFEYAFPAIRGIQARREFYISQCPLRLIPKLFLFDEEELSPDLRAQRVLNKARIPEMARYVLENENNYVFSALTASIDADVRFEPFGEADKHIGRLHVPMEARFIINDGQHRRAAIEAALKEEPRLGEETIAIVFFLDRGLERSQQMFADLNRHAVRPSKSLGVLYDHRDVMAEVVRLAVFRSPFFSDLVEAERTTLAPRSRKLFTLSALYSATSALLDDHDPHIESTESLANTARAFWEETAEHFPEWQAVRNSKLSASEVRQDFIHSHGIVLHGLGIAGRQLFRECPDSWRERLPALGKIDWRRANAILWEGRAMLGGRVSKARQNLILTTNVVKRELGLELGPEEQRVEDAYTGGKTL